MFGFHQRHVQQPTTAETMAETIWGGLTGHGKAEVVPAW